MELWPIGKSLISPLMKSGITYNLIVIKNPDMVLTWTVQLIKGDWKIATPEVLFARVVDESYTDTGQTEDIARKKVQDGIITPFNDFMNQYFSAESVIPQLAFGALPEGMLTWIEMIEGFLQSIVIEGADIVQPFTDVPLDHWAFNYITALHNQGIVRGFGDGTFRPDQLATRAELATIVARAFLGMK